MALSKEQSLALAQYIRVNFVAAYTRSDLYKVADIREENNCSEGEALYLFVKEKFEAIPLPENASIYPTVTSSQSKSSRRNQSSTIVLPGSNS